MAYTAAPVWRRVVARLIDLLLCVPLTFVAAIPVLIVCIPVYLVLGTDTGVRVGCALSFAVAYVALEYFLLLRRDGQTPGKGLLGLRVVDAGSGKLLSPASAGLRIATLMGLFMVYVVVWYAGYDSDSGTTSTESFSSVLIGLWVALLAVSLVAALVDRTRHRSVHDRAAGTVVVAASRRGIRLRQDAMMLVPGRVSLDKRL